MRYPHDPQDVVCPHCGEKDKPCSYVNHLARAWARAACQQKNQNK